MVKRQRAVRVRDLPDETTRNVHLYCRHCDHAFSATRADYFMLPFDAVLRHCGRNMILAELRTEYVPLELP